MSTPSFKPSTAASRLVPWHPMCWVNDAYNMTDVYPIALFTDPRVTSTIIQTVAAIDRMKEQR